ncbi:uncharacterized protein [Procambarus clarkii]|uniref:uncharacterized protein isoform X2 n=1 Tax=Procambarus clarkii TaxID=6728 RepID=UPI0037424ECD
MPNTSQVTVCVRCRLLHAAESDSPIISYFADDFDKELHVAVNWVDQKVEIGCCKYRLFMEVPVPVVLFTWIHFCLALDLPSRKYWFLYDDIFKEGALEVEDSSTLQIAGGGRLVVAQDLDFFVDSFDIRQSVHGDLAHLLVFSHALPSSSLRAFVRCQQLNTTFSPIIYFNMNMSLFKVRGSVEVSEAQLNSLCHKDSSSRVIIPERMNFQSSYTVCSRLKGSIIVPNSNDENTEIFNEFNKFNALCTNDFGTLFWLGFKGDLESGKWLTLTYNQPLTWNKLIKGYDKVKLGQVCASVDSITPSYDWYATPCHTVMCPICNFTSTPIFRVRGLCANSILDKILFLRDYKNNKPQFSGSFYTVISWDTDIMTWKLRSRGHRNLSGSMQIMVPNEYPVGIHKWTVTGDKCMHSEMDMLITACGEGEYTCSDGTCIGKTKRCDLVADCPDMSDELNCNMVQVPNGYSVEMPPPKKKNEPVPIEIFVEITSIREIDILSFKMVLDIILRMFWRDGRLTMINLREDANSNKVQDHKVIWVPVVQVEDGARSLADLTLRSESLVVQREASPLPDDHTRLLEDDIYLGSENTLELRQMYTVAFTCQFLLQRYPFDSQECSITFSLVDLPPSFVLLLQIDDLKTIVPSTANNGLKISPSNDETNFHRDQIFAKQ